MNKNISSLVLMYFPSFLKEKLESRYILLLCAWSGWAGAGEVQGNAGVASE